MRLVASQHIIQFSIIFFCFYSIKCIACAHKEISRHMYFYMNHAASSLRLCCDIWWYYTEITWLLRLKYKSMCRVLCALCGWGSRLLALYGRRPRKLTSRAYRAFLLPILGGAPRSVSIVGEIVIIPFDVELHVCVASRQENRPQSADRSTYGQFVYARRAADRSKCAGYKKAILSHQTVISISRCMLLQPIATLNMLRSLLSFW